jgi:hypothetical protein
LTTTGPDGRFAFDDLPAAGPARLFVNGLTAARPAGAPECEINAGYFPSLQFEPVLVPNAANALPSPVLLPPLDCRNARRYSTTRDTELTVEGVEGLRMIVRAGSMTLPTGQPAGDDAILSLNQVHHDAVPMPMPDGASPLFAWTLQPGGATFDPPIEIRYPNMAPLPAGAIANFLSFDHDTNRFEIVASGQVSRDGSEIVSDPGVGITVAGWGCSCPPYGVTGECRDCRCSGGGEGEGAGFLHDKCDELDGPDDEVGCLICCGPDNDGCFSLIDGGAGRDRQRLECSQGRDCWFWPGIRCGEVPEEFQYSVNGRSVIGQTRGFEIANISAPDNFGLGGPGSGRDGRSDDFLRVRGVSTAGGVTRYAYSGPSRLSRGRPTSSATSSSPRRRCGCPLPSSSRRRTAPASSPWARRSS